MCFLIVMIGCYIIVHNPVPREACYAKCVHDLYPNQINELVYKKYVNPIHICMPTCGGSI